MNFAVPISVTESTTEATAVVTRISVSKGIIRKIGVIFNSSADYTTFVKAEYHNHPIFPSNQAGYYIGDGETIYIEDVIPLQDHPFVITVKAWNTAGSANTVIFLLTVEPSGKE